jgi:hypothetical protein
MPIKKDRNAGDDWETVICPRILRRAKHMCERCLKPDKQNVYAFSVTDCSIGR